MKTELEQHGPVREKLTDGAVQDQKYRLVETADILDDSLCKKYMDGAWIGKYLEVWDTIDSTNRRVRQLGEEGAEEGALVISEIQTAGKGRRGRSWEAPKGSSLLCSFLLRPVCYPERVSMLTLVAALAVSAALEELTGIRTQIKWPNDIVYEKKKLCGILTEMSMEMDQIRYVVVGIGINVSTEYFPDELADKAGSLYLATGKRFERAAVLGLILKYFERYYALFEKTQDLSGMRTEYEARLAGKDDYVWLVGDDSRQRGICRGITDRGALCVEYEDGSVEEVISGEVSVRGLYGYI